MTKVSVWRQGRAADPRASNAAGPVRASASSIAISSLRQPSLTAPSMFMPANSAVGQAMEKNPTKEFCPQHRLRAEAVCLAHDHAEQRRRDIGTHIEQPRAVAHQRRTLDLAAHHNARAVDKAEYRDVERVAKLQETRAFVGTWRIHRCQSAFKTDPLSASKIDPPVERLVPVVHRGDPRAAECLITRLTSGARTRCWGECLQLVHRALGVDPTQRMLERRNRQPIPTIDAANSGA